MDEAVLGTWKPPSFSTTDVRPPRWSAVNRLHSYLWNSSPPSSPTALLESEQLLTGGIARDADREDEAHASGVELVLDRARLERGELLGQKRAGVVALGRLHLLVDAEHGGGVLGRALPVFLAVHQARPRVRGHGDPGLGARHPGLPGALGRGRPAVLVLLRRLAEVPDVARAILG